MFNARVTRFQTLLILLMATNEKQCCVAEFHGDIHKAGRPVLRSLQPLYLLARQSLEQCKPNVKSAGDKCMDNLFCHLFCQVAPEHYIFHKWKIADLHTAVTCDSIFILASNWMPTFLTFLYFIVQNINAQNDGRYDRVVLVKKSYLPYFFSM